MMSRATPRARSGARRGRRARVAARARALAPTLRARRAASWTASTAAARRGTVATRASAGVPDARVRRDRARDRPSSRAPGAPLHRPSRDPPRARVGVHRRRPRCASPPLPTAAAAAPFSAILPIPSSRAGPRLSVWSGAPACRRLRRWVFSMVVLGGVTRLTRSGLSMTDWRFEWERPPRHSRTLGGGVRQVPRVPRVPQDKRAHDRRRVQVRIFWMEYAHRMWGRALGAYFALPLAAFAAKGWITRALAGRLFGGFRTRRRAGRDRMVDGEERFRRTRSSSAANTPRRG